MNNNYGKRFLLIKDGMVYGMSGKEPDSSRHPEYYECKTDEDFKVVVGSYRNDDGNYSLPVIKNNEENPFSRFPEKNENCLTGNCKLRYNINKYYEEIVNKSNINYNGKRIKLDGIDIQKIRDAERFLERNNLLNEKIFIPQYDKENKEFIAHEFSSLDELKGFLESYDNFVGENILALSKNISDPKEDFKNDDSWKTDIVKEIEDSPYSQTEEELKEEEEKEIRRILERRGFTEEQIQQELARMRGDNVFGDDSVPVDDSSPEEEKKPVEEEENGSENLEENEAEETDGGEGSTEFSEEEEKEIEKSPEDIAKEREEEKKKEEEEKEKEKLAEEERRKGILYDFNLSYPGLDPYTPQEEAYIISKIESGIDKENVFNVINSARENKKIAEEERLKEEERKKIIEEEANRQREEAEKIKEEKEKEELRNKELFDDFMMQNSDLSPFSEDEKNFISRNISLGEVHEKIRASIINSRGLPEENDDDIKEDQKDDSTIPSAIEKNDLVNDFSQKYPDILPLSTSERSRVGESLSKNGHSHEDVYNSIMHIRGKDVEGTYTGDINNIPPIIWIDDVPIYFPEMAPYSMIESRYIYRGHNSGKSKEEIYAGIENLRGI